MQRRDRVGAVAGFRRAIELRPDFAQAHNNLANALKEQGNFEEALACYRQPDPGNWDSVFAAIARHLRQRLGAQS